jgi:hypothetical protein
MKLSLMTIDMPRFGPHFSERMKFLQTHTKVEQHDSRGGLNKPMLVI